MDDLTPDQLQVLLQGPRWGFLENGGFVPVPKPPMLLANLRAPCTIVMAWGEKREIIVEADARQ